MPVQTEFARKSFEQMFEGFRKAAASTLEMQQDLFRQWTAAWPGLPKSPASWTEPFPQFCKDWTKTAAEMTRKYLETCERQYRTGVEALESAFATEANPDPAELQQKMMELWQKSFECLKDLAETQMKHFQTAVGKWMELVKKGQTCG